MASRAYHSFSSRRW